MDPIWLNCLSINEVKIISPFLILEETALERVPWLESSLPTSEEWKLRLPSWGLCFLLSFNFPSLLSCFSLQNTRAYYLSKGLVFKQVFILDRSSCHKFWSCVRDMVSTVCVCPFWVSSWWAEGGSMGASISMIKRWKQLWKWGIVSEVWVTPCFMVLRRLFERDIVTAETVRLCEMLGHLGLCLPPFPFFNTLEF